ncbi:MAG: 50S ribosomal protein L18 [Syntrophomonadaceae bacterium]|nr:50S ribosomal protein L18 [Syntrophomonadaceae bacterium]
MTKKTSKKVHRQIKHKRIRKKIFGTSERPRLCVYKSLRHIYAQIIDDQKGVTLAAASTLDEGLNHLPSKKSKDAAKEVGKNIARRAIDKNIKTVIFDRSGYKYHGCIAALADAAREEGLDF